jgi:hypothetical protein
MVDDLWAGRGGRGGSEVAGGRMKEGINWGRGAGRMKDVDGDGGEGKGREGYGGRRRGVEWTGGKVEEVLRRCGVLKAVDLTEGARSTGVMVGV